MSKQSSPHPEALPERRFVPAKILAFTAIVLLSTARAPSVEAADWVQKGHYRQARLEAPGAGSTGFTLLAPGQTGIHFTNLLAEERSLTNHILLNGSGVAVGDVDGDGLCDLYFCGLDGANALYKNLGNWKFQDITKEAGVACADLDATGAVFADVDGDGDLDLLVNAVGKGTSLFLNDGHGNFREATAQSGLSSRHGAMSFAVADVNGDGLPDIYVVNYRSSTIRDSFNLRLKTGIVNGARAITMVNGRPVTEPDLVGRFSLDEAGGIIENGEADTLFLNKGGGVFEPVSFTGGAFLDEAGQPLASPPYDWGLSAMFRDMNGDGLPDLYVCNDLNSPDRVWVNQGGGKFKAMSSLAVRKTSWFSMGVDFADLNRDGLDEFLVVDMLSRSHQTRHTQVSSYFNSPVSFASISERHQNSRNTLFLNLGNGEYSEIAFYAGLEATEWSWSPVFLDVDLDGYEDLLVATGFERDVQDGDIAQSIEKTRVDKRLGDADALQLRKRFKRLATPKQAFRNRRDMTFEDVGSLWRFNAPGVSQGMALADLDNDGDLDVVINNMNSPASVYRNDSPAPRIAVRLRGQGGNTVGVGAKIKLIPLAEAALALPVQSQEMVCGGRYLSGDDAVRAFAAGAATNRFRIEVAWRSGKTSAIAEAVAGFVYELDEAGSLPVPAEAKPARKPLFEDVSRLLAHSHYEEPFDDSVRQPLLDRQFSLLGPGVAWYDLDGDGLEDLIVGSGRGGKMAVFRNDGKGGFVPVDSPSLRRPVSRDQTGLAGLAGADGKRSLLAGSSNYEDGVPLGGSVRSFEGAAALSRDAVPGQAASSGPISLADLGGDGGMELFVGGRILPGRYPEAASSALFKRDQGVWKQDLEGGRAFENIGLVSGSVFSDINGDGRPDLVLACEWGPIRVFLNQKGKLVDATTELGLDRYTGWWNGVTVGDFDGDGRMDIVASNWGRNTKYQSHREAPAKLYYGDWTGSGRIDMIAAYYDAGLKKNVPWRTLDSLESALPWLAEKFPTRAEFGLAGIGEILAGTLTPRELSANWLETTLFLNRGGRFEAVVLPFEAQLSPAFGIAVADFDGDGSEDLFLAQNFFDTEPQTGRYDAGHGVVLKGDGKGGFRAMGILESGVNIHGEQRGAAAADYDGDGRVDLVVAQNGNETKLFRNSGAKPGLRIRLIGPPGNPDAIGACLRLADESGRPVGPARELHAGSGYFSQEGLVQVMAARRGESKVWVRWPGGKTSLHTIPANARDIALVYDGGTKLLK